MTVIVSTDVPRSPSPDTDLPVAESVHLSEDTFRLENSLMLDNAENRSIDSDKSSPPAQNWPDDSSAAPRSALISSKTVSSRPGVPEIFRINKNQREYRTPPLEVEAGDEASVDEIIERSLRTRFPLSATPHPISAESYGTTVELFSRIRSTIAEQTGISKRSSSLLAYWVFSTWFTEALPLAPCLAIGGSTHGGDVVLRTLKMLCRNSLLMASVNADALKRVNWHVPPTLLIYEPDVSKKLIAIIGASTRPGYLVSSREKDQDYFGSKAIFLGDNLNLDQLPRYGVYIDATAKDDTETNDVRCLTESNIQHFQNQLEDYRLRNLVKVYKSTFDAKGLPLETRAIANALGACLVDAPGLQSEIVSALAPYAEQRLVDRTSSLEALTIEAALALWHRGKDRLFVREIADEVNSILKARGENLKLNPETVGHKLKKVNLHTRRLGKAGNGLVMDQATNKHILELSAMYLGAGTDE